MQFRRLGTSGMKVSALAYGNWLTHGGQVAEDAAQACIRAALDAGITTFDTADVYAAGRAEEVLGRGLAHLRRDSVEIFTKVYWPTGEGPNDRGLSRKHILRSIEGSLRRLNTDYVDLYQAHRYDYETPLEETMLAFADLVRSGKTLYIGVSEWNAEQIRQAALYADELGVGLVSNQPQYSALWRVVEAQVIPACRELGISQIAWSPVAQGVLTGKYRPGHQNPRGSRATDSMHGGKAYIQRLMSDEVLYRVEQLRPLAEQAGLTMAQMALAWVLSNDNVAAAIIGASRPEQVQENVQAVDIALDSNLKDQIDAILAPVAQTDPSLTLSPNPRA